MTTLLDCNLYPADEILHAYFKRWQIETSLNDLKTTLGMDTFRCKTPEMVQKEAYMYLIAHNLIRYTMAVAASTYEVPISRISFKGSIDALRQFSNAMSQARSLRRRQDLWAKLLFTLAKDLIPLRPGRREPRAVKRKKNKYPRLNTKRSAFKDHPKRHTRRRNARNRNALAGMLK